MRNVLKTKTCHYPESDGKPMGETDRHRHAMIRHIELLSNYYRGQEVYVSGDLLVYYEQGNPKKFVVPDAFVAKGLPPREHRTYKTWVEGKAPDVVIETTSKKTKTKDLVTKPQIYAQLGVAEYFLFDPEQDYLDPPLRGHRLVAGGYQDIPEDPRGGLVSEQLGLRLCIEKGNLQFYRLDTNERLLTADERALLEAAARDQAEAARDQAEAALAAEANRRKALEEELLRLREELARRTT
jgi:Uma2 family endonuclease